MLAHYTDAFWIIFLFFFHELDFPLFMLLYLLNTENNYRYLFILLFYFLTVLKKPQEFSVIKMIYA